MDYVITVGFVDVGPPNIVVVRRNKPEWQRGKFNLPGGRIDLGELPFDAAMRTFENDTSVELEREVLYEMGIIKIEDNRVFVYRGYLTEMIDDSLPRDEPAYCLPWSFLKLEKDLIPNLRVIIPLCINGVTNWVISAEEGNSCEFTIRTD